MANSHMKCYLSAPSWPTCPRHENAGGRQGGGRAESLHLYILGVAEGSRTRARLGLLADRPGGPHCGRPSFSGHVACSRLPRPPPSCTHMAEKQALARGASWHLVRLAARHAARAGSQAATRSRPARPGLYRTEQAAPCGPSGSEAVDRGTPGRGGGGSEG